MNNEQNYKYYRVTGDIVAELNARHAVISERRREIKQQVMKESGAVALTTSHAFGANGSNIVELVFAADHKFPCRVKVKRKEVFEGKEVIIVRADNRQKEGKRFTLDMAQLLLEANIKLACLTSYIDFIIDHFGVRFTTTHPTGDGRFYLASTRAGASRSDRNVLLFSIPNAGKVDKQPSVPECFEQLTYGVFYDLTQSDLKEIK